MKRAKHFALRAISEAVHRIARTARLAYYNVRAFVWHRPAPLSTVIYGRLDFAHLPCRVRLGPNCALGDGVYFSTGRKAEIVFGARVDINRGCTIVASERIEIGDDVAIGEYVSIRDQAHHFDPDKGVHGQGFKVAPVKIGNHCWIGRGVFIGPGTTIGDGSVVGANSVVHGEFPAGVLIAGAPARIKKYFTQSNAPSPLVQTAPEEAKEVSAR